MQSLWNDEDAARLVAQYAAGGVNEDLALRVYTTCLLGGEPRLVQHGVLTKSDDPTHKQKAIYSLTEKGIALLPIVVQIGAWGSRWVPDARKLDAGERKVLREIQEGGPRAWTRRMDDLRAEHLR